MSFTRVQGTGNASTASVLSESATLTGVSVGDLLIVIADGYVTGGSPPTLSISDSQGNTWTQAETTSATYAVTSERVTAWYAVVTTGGSVAVTVSSGISGSISFSFDEWSYTGSLSVDDYKPGSGTSTTPATGNLSLTGTDLVVAGFGVNSFSLTYTAGTGFTLGYTVNTLHTKPFASEYNAAQSTTPVAPSITLSSSSVWLGVAVAFTATSTPATVVYALDRGSEGEYMLANGLSGDIPAGNEAALERNWAGDVESAAESFLAFLMGPEASTGLDTGLPGAWSGDSATEGENQLVTVQAWSSVTSTDFGTASESSLAIPWDTDVSLDIEASMESYIIWAVDSGFGDDSAFLETVVATVLYLSLDPASSQESAPAPTAWDSDPASGTEGVRAIDWGGDLGGEAETGPGTGSAVLLTTTLIALDFAAASEAATWSSLLVSLDQGFAGEAFGLDLLTSGYYVYANTGIGDPINYNVAVATILGLSNTTWVSAGLAYPGVWKWGIRAFNPCGVETNVDCMVTIVLDATGKDITNVPNAPIGLRAIPLAGGAIKVEWYFPAVMGAKQPVGFYVYCTAGATIDYTTSSATVPYGAGFLNAFQTVITGLTGGDLYTIGVRAYNQTGTERNTYTVSVTAVTAGPTAVVDLTAIPVV